MLLERVLPAAIFSAGKAEGAPRSIVTQATANAGGGKMDLALRVALDNAPLRVARRSFGFTKPFSSCLD